MEDAVKLKNAEIERLKAELEHGEGRIAGLSLYVRNTGPCNTTHHACDCVIRNVERLARIERAAREYVSAIDDDKWAGRREAGRDRAEILIRKALEAK